VRSLSSFTNCADIISSSISLIGSTQPTFHE
jgi:hypothetical protein